MISMKNKDKRRTARYYERFSRYQTTKKERDFNNYWKMVIEVLREGKIFLERMYDE